MSNMTQPKAERKWLASGHASLCALGASLQELDFFAPIAERVHLKQKVYKFSPVQKLEMIFVALLTGATAISHTDTTLRLDPALQQAFGLPGCAEQSVLADTLNAATDQDVTALREAVALILQRHSHVRQHDLTQASLVLDLDLSPLPTTLQGDGVERGSMGRSRCKSGRKLARVRVATTQETLWEEVLAGRMGEGLPLVQTAATAVERLLGLEGDGVDVRATRARIEWRLDSGWGSTAILDWLLTRGYQVTAKFKSTSRVKKLVRPIQAWQATASAGRDVAPVPAPVALATPTVQYAVRTPSRKKADGYQYAVVVTSRRELSMQAVVTHYDARAGMEADLKADKYGLGLGKLRKRQLPAQRMLLLLGQLAHNVLIWARDWLAVQTPRLRELGIVRLVRDVWAIPGRVQVVEGVIQRVRLCGAHPRARAVCDGLAHLLPPGQLHVFLGQT